MPPIVLAKKGVMGGVLHMLKYGCKFVFLNQAGLCRAQTLALWPVGLGVRLCRYGCRGGLSRAQFFHFVQPLSEDNAKAGWVGGIGCVCVPLCGACMPRAAWV